MRVARGAAVLAAAAVLVAAAGLPAQTGGWRTDERVLVTDFGIVTAIARSPGSVFAATTGGLLELDEAFGELAPPVTVEDEYPRETPTAMAYDPRDRSVWIAFGGLMLGYDPFARRFRERLALGRPVTAIVPPPGSGSLLYVRMTGDWWSVDTFSRAVRPVDAASVRAAIDARSDLRARWQALGDPFFLQSAENAVRSQFRGPVRVLDAVPSRTAWEWWLATAGEFVVAYDGVGRVARRSAVGPAGSGMAAVEATGSAVWFAPEEALEGRYGLAAAAPDLQDWRVWRADSSRSVPVAVRDLASVPGGMWAGGESGLYWLGEDDAEWRQERAVDLSYHPVITLAPASGPDPRAVWVGTARGLVRVAGPDLGIDAALLPGVPVTSVVEADGVAWIGTDRGLYVASPPDSTGRAPEAARAAGPAPLRSAVGALAAARDTVYAALDREVWMRPGRGALWMRVEPIGAGRTPVTALAVRDGVLWAGSAVELTVLEAGGGRVDRFVFGPDLPPGPRGETGVADVAIVSGSEGWVALPAGALRISLGR